jgi:integrase
MARVESARKTVTNSNVLTRTLLRRAANAGLRITEALEVRVRDVRVVDGIARSVRVIGKGNRERLVPLPKEFGQVFGFWLSDRGKDDLVFAKEPGRQGLRAPSAVTSAGYSIARGSTRRSRRTSSGTPTPRDSSKLGPSSSTSRRCPGM